jgi:hypothetical protein
LTTFSIGVGAHSGSATDARFLIAYLNGPGAEATKRRFGMEPG